MVVWNGVFYGLMCIVFRTAYRRNPKTAPFVIAVILVAYQYLFISRWWLGTYVGFLPYALYRFPVFTQILDIAGVHGLMFVLVLFQSVVAEILITPRQTIKASTTIIAFALIILQIVYGIISLNYWKHVEPDSSLKLGVVQPNCGDYDEEYETDRGYERLRNQILSIAEENPDLIVTSETAFTYPLEWFVEHPLTRADISKLGVQTYYNLLNVENKVTDILSVSREIGIPLIIGHPDKILQEGNDVYPDGFNTGSLLVNRMSLIENGEVTDVYDKIHLAPVLETLPLNNTGLVGNLYQKAGLQLYKSGTGADPLEIAGLKIGTPICFEGHFPYICSGFDADLFISSGSNSYDRIGWGQLHDAMISSFRAIENRRTYVRIFNTGLSCSFTPWGKMVDKLKTNEMTEAVWEINVYNSKKTLYSLAPDLLGIVASIFAFVYVVMLIVEKKRKKI